MIKPCPKFATAECVRKAELEASFNITHDDGGATKTATKAATKAKAAFAKTAKAEVASAKAAAATGPAIGAATTTLAPAVVSAGVSRSTVATLPTPAPAPSFEVTLTVVLAGQQISSFASPAALKWRAVVAAVAEALAVDVATVSVASVHALARRRRRLVEVGALGVELHVVIRVADQSSAFFLVTEIESPTFSSFLSSSLSAHGLATAPQQLELHSPHIKAPQAVAAAASARASAAVAGSGGIFGVGGALGSPAARYATVGCAATVAVLLLVVQCRRLHSALAQANAEYESKQGSGFGGSIAHGYQGGGAYMDRGAHDSGYGVDMASLGGAMTSSPRGISGAADSGQFNSLLDTGNDGIDFGGNDATGGVATIIEY